MLLHPSIPTCFNTTQKILSLKEKKKLQTEMNDPELFTKILQRHEFIRLFDTRDPDSSEITSGLSIVRVISLWAYIHKI